MTRPRQRQLIDEDSDKDGATSVQISKSLKREYAALCTKDDTYEDIFKEALAALKERRRQRKT
jgi:hypothetical protein